MFKSRSGLALLAKRKMPVLLLLGFSSGLPLALTAGTLQAWMAVEGVDIKSIGLLALAGLPYTLKFLWSPIMDRFIPPALGRRRGWLIATQLLLSAAIAAMAFGNPALTPIKVGVLALLTAFASASQDIAADAYRTDVLEDGERGLGVGLFVTGYRIGMLTSGAVALILAEAVGWQQAYLLMSSLMVVGIAAALFAEEPALPKNAPRNIKQAVVQPFKDYLSRRSALPILLLILLYKLGDAYAGTLTTPFLITGVGFSPTEVGVVNKGFGLVALLIGATIGGGAMARLGLYRSLLIFGILQAVSNLSFMLLAIAGKNMPLLMFSIGFENLCGGMGTSAFVALLMALCSKSFSATQFSLLSSIAAVGRVIVAPTSGYLVSAVGWELFFILTSVIALPGIIMLIWLRKDIQLLEHEKN